MDLTERVQNFLSRPFSQCYTSQELAVVLFFTLLVITFVAIICRRLAKFSFGRRKCALEDTVISSLQEPFGSSPAYALAEDKDKEELEDPKIAQEECTKYEETYSGIHEELKVLNDRSVPGLVGVLVVGDTSTIVEITCKTQEMMRDDRFQELVVLAAKACIKFAFPHAPCYSLRAIRKLSMDMSQFRLVKAQDGKPLSEHAEEVSKEIGEEIFLKAAICFRAIPGIHLCGYVHPSNITKDDTKLGAFGGIAAIKRAPAGEPGPADMAELGQKLCERIAKMDLAEVTANTDTCPGWTVTTPMPETDEKVKEVLSANNLQIVDMARFQCRKSWLDEDDDDDEEEVEEELQD